MHGLSVCEARHQQVIIVAIAQSEVAEVEHVLF
jgi:hypothetical protein